MQATRKGPDFIAIDGGEGGTGAAPLVFSDSVAYPFRIGFAKVFDIFYTRGLHTEIILLGLGNLVIQILRWRHSLSVVTWLM